MQWERERALSQRLITLDDQTSHQVRGEGESSQWMEGRADGRSGTPALVRLPLSMPNDELVLTRRTDQRRTERGERTSRHHSTDCPERLSIASCPIRHRRQRGEFLLTIALRRYGIMDSFLRASHSRSHTRGTGESRDHSLLSSPSFPFITLTLWPRPPPSRRAMPPGSAITPSAAQVEVQCTARSSPSPRRRYIDSTLPISALGSSERETDDRVWSESSPGKGYQVRGPPTPVPSRMPEAEVLLAMP